MSKTKESIPKYLSISQHLRRQIVEGKLPAGTRLPAQTQLARDYGVSLLTARQALGELEREGLVDQRPGHGTFIANNTPTGSGSLSVGLVIVDSANKSTAYCMSLIEQIGETLSDSDYDLKIATLEDSAFSNRPPHPMLDRRRVRAVVMDGFVTQLHVSLIQSLGLEVLLAGNHAVSADVPQIYHDVKKASYELGREMMTLEHGPLILFTEPYRYYYTTQILLGYQTAAYENGQSPIIYSALPDAFNVWDDILETIVARYSDQFCLMTMVRGTESVLARCKTTPLSVRTIPTCILGPATSLEQDLQPWIIPCVTSGQMIGRTAATRLIEAIKENKPVRGQVFEPVVRRMPVNPDVGWPITCEWRTREQAQASELVQDRVPVTARSSE
jgi:DNA-binding transcriptional regulator YhcF (GntR family)